ncbi:YtcA family lipoprotein [Paraburkholderia sp. 2C]
MLLASPVFCAISGCASAPSIAVFGAGFPDWLFCVAGGIAATAAVHLLLVRRDKQGWLAPIAISYPALGAAIAMAIWLIFFPG